MDLNKVKAPGAGEEKRIVKVSMTEHGHGLLIRAARATGRSQSEIIERLLREHVGGETQ